jgi:hypothetical protein
MPKRTRQVNPFLSGTLEAEARNERISIAAVSGSDGEEFVPWESTDQLLIVFSNETRQNARHITANCARSVDVLVKHIAECLQRNELNGNDARFSSLSDAALVLLPWAMQLVATHGVRRSLVFRALAASLDYLQLQRHDPFCESQRLRILTQSAMFKLIPIVAQCALECPPGCSEDEPSTRRKRTSYKLVSEDEECDEECESLISSNEDLGRHASRVFCLLLPYYTPTLDVACNAILLPVVHSLDLHNTYLKRHVLGEDPAGIDDERSIVLIRSLEWLLKLASSPGVNPKTTFSIFATPSIMLAFARCYIYFDHDDRPGSMLCDKPVVAANSRQVVVVALLDRFFDQKHLDGFRSLLLSQQQEEDTTRPGVDQGESAVLDDKTSFRTYQEELFCGLTAAMTSELAPHDETAADDPHKRPLEAHDMTNIFPILLDGFMSAAEKWHGQQQVDKGSRPADQRTRTDAFSRFQFQMFERLTRPLRLLVVSEAARIDHDREISASLASLSACLEILLKYKGYLPARDESDRSQYRLLEQTTLMLLTFVANDRHFDGIQQLGCVLVGLRWLFKLDHRLLLPRLSDVLVLCSACRDVRLSAPVNSLLLSVVDTYRLLRQQSALCKSLLRSSADSVQVLINHLSDPAVVQAMAESIEHCTTLQASKLLDLIKEDVSEVCDICESECDTKLKMIGYLCEIFTSHVPLDTASVSDIAVDCESFLEGPVSRLLAHGQRLGGSIGPRVTLSLLSLCGMVLELQERCAFVEGIDSPVPIPLPFMELLHATTARAISDSVQEFGDEMDALADGWMALWCHRLRIIHSILQREDDERDREEDLDVETLVSEAKALTYLTTRAASEQTCVKGGGLSRWVMISTNLSAWLSYATDVQVRLFLNWLFTLVTLDPTTPCVPPTSGLGSRKEFSEIERELGFAMQLFRDTSFLSHDRIKKWLRLSAISSSVEWVSWALSEVESNDTGWIKLRGLIQSSPIDVFNWKNFGAEDLRGIAVEITPLSWASAKFVSSVSSRLQRASRPIKVVNGLSTLVDDVESSRIFIDAAFRLVHIIRSLAKSKRRLRGEVMDFIGVLQHSMSNVVRLFNSQNFLDVKQLLSILVGTMTSALSMYLECEGEKENDSMALGVTALTVGARSLTRQLTSLILSFGDREISVLSSVRALVKHENAFEGNVPCFVLSLGRAIVDALPMSESHTKEALLIRDELWVYIVSLAEAGPETEISNSICLILGDMIRTFGDWETGSWPMKHLLIKYVDSVMAKLQSGSWTSDANRRGYRYLIASMSATCPKPQLVDAILTALLRFPACEDPYLEATFCRLAENLSSQSVDYCLEMLLGLDVSCMATGLSRVRLVRLLLQCVDRTAQTDTLSTHGPQLLHFALSHMNVVGNCERTYAAVEACHVARFLIRSHDILPLRDRDLARILSHLSSILGPRSDMGGDANATVLETRWLSTDLYLACSQVFLSMFQRYTKHLYSCVPSVISVLHF